MVTESALRSKVAAWLVPYIGLTEGDDRHKAILKVFNDSKLCSRYTMTVNDAWCATAVSAAFIACGLSKIFPCVECSCARMLSLASAAGIWVENDAYVPKVGDVVLYDWQDSGIGDNTGTPDHVGIVYSISGATMKIIEGNKTDTVGYRSLAVNGKYIRGFITPQYSCAADTNAATASNNTENAPYVVGDIVEFTGTKHYTSANSTTAKICTGGQAKVTLVSENAAHPYHLVHIGSGCTVYGWVDAADISKVDTFETVTESKEVSYSIGDKVIVTGTIYGNGNGTGGSLRKSGATMYVVNLVDGRNYTHYIGLATAKGGTRQGWANPSILTKA